MLEGPGDYWLPNPGSAPSGVVWSRGKHGFRVDPMTGARTSVKLPRTVVTASWGPDDSSFAYISRKAGSAAPWRLHVGTSVEEAVDREVEMPRDAPLAKLLGWQDATHVVVGHYRTWVHVVDVETGEAQRIDLAGSGQQINAPMLANALWQQPLTDPVAPSGTSDPRGPWRWAALVLLLAGAGAVVVRRRRS